MKLVIVHYHFRPGGVRRIIELAVPHLLREYAGAISSVTLAGGEKPDAHWLKHFRRPLGRTPLEVSIAPSFGYYAEQSCAPKTIAHRVRAGLAKLFDGARAGECLVWAHNLSLARNPLLSTELEKICAARGLTLVAHHHDWWFENRWRRWPELRRAGFSTLGKAAGAVLACGPNVRHVAINQADARLLALHFPQQSAWLPNLAAPSPPPPKTRVLAARRWLARQVGERDAPVWLLPCRLLRRKNIAEALLLKRWLRPEAWLLTTGGVSSADEQAYAGRLAEAAHAHGWRLQLGILSGDESGKPSVPELLAASEAVMLTSIQEGFGLPYLEAASAHRPLIARRLPNVAPDLAQFGFRFPQSYDELLVDPSLFDHATELRRQKRLFRQWLGGMPRACRELAGRPAVLQRESPHPVPFSRLTLTAQIEVLCQPPDHAWKLCAPLNGFLKLWRRRAAAGKLQPTPWPRTADQWLSGPAYAQHFRRIAEAPAGSPAPTAQSSITTQAAFLHERLGAAHLFPLLWVRNS